MAKFNFAQIGMKVVGLGAGAAAAKFINKPLANLNPKLRAVGKIGAGVALPLFIKKNQMVSNIGDGMIAVGVAELVGEFIPALAGIDDNYQYESLGDTEVPYLPDDREEDNLN